MSIGFFRESQIFSSDYRLMIAAAPPTPDQSPRRATTKDIALRLNVARSTVSTVLSGGSSNTRVSDDLRSRVIETAREMGYRPNSAARAMKSGRQGCAGLVLSSLEPGRSTLPELVLRGLAEGLQLRDMHLAVNVLSDEVLIGNMPRLLKDWAADGLVLNYNKHLPEGLAELVDWYSIPSVWINRRVEHTAVFPDDFAAGVTAGRELLERGHQRIAYVSLFREPEGIGHYSETDRPGGLAHALTEAGLTLQTFYPSPGDSGDPTERLIAAFSGDAPPTAVVAYGSGDINLIALAAAQCGLSIPEKLSVVGFGGRPLVCGRNFSTVLCPEHSIGLRASSMLVEKIENPGVDIASVALPFDFVPDASSIASVHG